MKKIKVGLYVLGIICIAAITQIAVNKLFIDEDRVLETFVNVNENVCECNLDVTVEYGEKILTVKQKRELLNELAHNAGIKDGYKISNSSEESVDSVSLEKSTSTSDYTIEMVSLPVEDSKSDAKDSHFSLYHFTETSDFTSILDYKKKVEKSIKELDAKDSQSFVTVHGTYTGEMSKETRKEKVNNLLDKLNATEINTVESEDLYTVYAYTGLMEDYIEVSGCRMNINIAISYDEEKDETDVYLATPILNECY